MKQELDSFLGEASAKLEKKRRKLNFWNKLYRIFIRPITFLVGLGLVILIIIGLFIPPMLFWALAFGAAYLGLNSINRPDELYYSYIKEGILPDLFNRINSDFNYEPYGLDTDMLNQSGIFTKSFFNNHTYINGEDLVFGTIDNVSVHFNEIKFYREQVNYLKTLGSFLLTIILIPIVIVLGIINFFQDGGDGNKMEIPFFEVIREEVRFYKGLFMCADFHKNFNGEIFLIPKQIESLKDKLNDKFTGTNLQEFKIENIELATLYKMYCSNQQMGYYVLSPKIIEALYEIISVEKILPVVTFREGKMFMTIPWNKDYFSVDLKHKVTGSTYFTKYINEINSFQKIIKHFSLDQRIWSKE